jgi:hypothetical protein
MMTTHENTPALAVMIDLQARGIELRADGEELRAAPRARLTSTDHAQLRELKPELLGLLRQGDRGERQTPAPAAPSTPAHTLSATTLALLERLEAFAEDMSKTPPEPITRSIKMHDTLATAPVVVTKRGDRALVARVGDRTWYGYQAGLVFGELGAATTVEAYLRDVDVAEPEPPMPEEEREVDYTLMVRRSLWAQAQAVAALLGWEGDFNGPPRVFTLPDPDRCEYLDGFVFQQDHRLTTFVISPFPMPWLEPGWSHDATRQGRGVSSSPVWRN